MQVYAPQQAYDQYGNPVNMIQYVPIMMYMPDGQLTPMTHVVQMPMTHVAPMAPMYTMQMPYMMSAVPAPHDDSCSTHVDTLSEAGSHHSGSSTAAKNTVGPSQTVQPRVLRYNRGAPAWSLTNGMITPEERASMPDGSAPVDVALFRVFPLRGPKDLADLLVAIGFEFDAASPVGILRARLPRDARANRCSGYAFVECRNRAVADLLEAKVSNVVLLCPPHSAEHACMESSSQVGVGEVRNRAAPGNRKLKLEWKAVVAPGCVEASQREVEYGFIANVPVVIS